jgi:hypothetical protein
MMYLFIQRSILRSVRTLWLLPLLVIAAKAEANAPKLSLSGTFAMEQGQILRSHLQQINYDTRQWLHRDLLRFRVEATLNNHLTIAAEPEVKLWFNTFPKGRAATNVPFRQYSFVSILEGKGTWSFFGNDTPLLTLGAGMFPVKYNDDATNLGEYLFRTGAYPPYVYTSFDYPFGRLFGFHLHSTLFDVVKQDLFLHSEIETQPLHDWSLSYMANGSLSDIAEAGAGISLTHWFPVVDQLTHQEIVNNSYHDENGTLQYYDFKGIKLMGRAAFDPKKLLPSEVTKKFGIKDLRIYLETAVLGLENRPAYRPQISGTDTLWLPDSIKNYYADIKERIPVMIGFTFPTCNLFDYLSFEIEYYRWRYTNSFYYQEFYSESAIPTPNLGMYTADDYKYDRWKWSLSYKKTLTKGFSILGLFARDHMHHEHFNQGDRDESEALIRSYDWSWIARVQYNF